MMHAIPLRPALSYVIQYITAKWGYRNDHGVKSTLGATIKVNVESFTQVLDVAGLRTGLHQLELPLYYLHIRVIIVIRFSCVFEAIHVYICHFFSPVMKFKY